MERYDLFLVRHGEIEQASSLKFPDGDRPLSKLGAQKIEALGRMLREVGIRPGTILHSPLQRTTETAQILGDTLAVSLAPWSRLADELTARSWSAELQSKAAAHPSLLLVGHEPSLLGLICELTGIAAHSIELPRGTCVHLSVTSFAPMLSGQLTNLISPKLVSEWQKSAVGR